MTCVVGDYDLSVSLTIYNLTHTHMYIYMCVTIYIVKSHAVLIHSKIIAK